MPAQLDAGPVVLRRLEEAHLDGMMAAIEESFAELRLWMPWAVELPTFEGQREWLRGAVQRYAAGDEFAYAILSGDRYVGGCGAHNRVGPSAMELGYWISTPHTGRGYATAAARALTDAVFAHLPHIEWTEIHTDAANFRSAAVARKLGYRLDRIVDWPVDAPGQTGRRMVWILPRRPF
jgi:RimJ/RimL family protein N-acetyltransferase